MKKFILSVIALMLVTLITSLDSYNNVDKKVSQDIAINTGKTVNVTP
ncbi:MAG: hypothetical protein P8P73_08495 [Flavobacteriaceae bacterium]|nr:hypothetical protein [Flavobacteriaceae bacterium]MDG2349149.1 hypothetical protein [Flavobacteriaceae bacterium]